MGLINSQYAAIKDDLFGGNFPASFKSLVCRSADKCHEFMRKVLGFFAKMVDFILRIQASTKQRFYNKAMFGNITIIVFMGMVWAFNQDISVGYFLAILPLRVVLPSDALTDSVAGFFAVSLAFVPRDSYVSDTQFRNSLGRAFSSYADCISFLESLNPFRHTDIISSDEKMSNTLLTSQFFANVYLNELDQFVKHTLKAQYYLRYVDDFVILSLDPKELSMFLEKIDAFIPSLKLTLHPRRRKLLPVSNGIDFLGYIVRHNYILVRRRVISNLKEKIKAFRRQRIRNITKFQNTFASYLGHFKLANTFRLRKRYGLKYQTK